MGDVRLRLPVGVQLNYIARLWSAPCQDKWSIAIETALPVIASSVLLILTPSLDEILENYLQPKLGRRGARFGGQNQRRSGLQGAGRKYRIWAGAFPDVDEEIADSLPARRFFAGRTPGNLERWIWTGIDITDMVGWYFLIASVAVDGTYKWASNIMHALHCQANVAMSGSWKKNSCPIVGLVPWSSGVESYLHEEKNMLFQPDGEFRAADGSILTGCTVNWVVRFVGRGFARMGPMRLKLLNGVSTVYDSLDGSEEVLDFFEEGDLQVAGSFTTGVKWDRGFLTYGTGVGAGFRCDGYLSEGQVFGG